MAFIFYSALPMDFKFSICLVLLLLGALSVQGENKPRHQAKRKFSSVFAGVRRFDSDSFE